MLIGLWHVLGLISDSVVPEETIVVLRHEPVPWQGVLFSELLEFLSGPLFVLDQGLERYILVGVMRPLKSGVTTLYLAPDTVHKVERRARR